MNEELLSRLDQLANKLGTTIDYLWPKLVRYELISNSAQLAIFCVMFILLTYVAIRLCKAFVKETEKSESDALFCLTCIVGLIALVILASAVVTVPKVFVPEVAALKTLGNIIK